jgi:hypothetical protein
MSEPRPTKRFADEGDRGPIRSVQTTKVSPFMSRAEAEKDAKETLGIQDGER